MKNIFIIHGAYGNPEENWFPWLKSKLEMLGHNVFVPQFPTPENQTLIYWLKVFEEYKSYVNENTILVGHSIGPAFILSVLEQLNQPVTACYFVAGFIGAFTGKYADPAFDKINKTFAEKEFNWPVIKKNCPKFHLYYSDNDPYVPQDKAVELGKLLGTKPMLVKNAGHFNESAGYRSFELLLDDMMNEL